MSAKDPIQFLCLQIIREIEAEEIMATGSMGIYKLLWKRTLGKPVLS